MRYMLCAWAAVGIYGWPEAVDRQLTWNLVREIRGATSLPITFFEDFSEILYDAEKEGGWIEGRDKSILLERLWSCVMFIIWVIKGVYLLADVGMILLL